MPDALELLKTRRSVKPREMTGPGPSPAELDTILTIGAVLACKPAIVEIWVDR